MSLIFAILTVLCAALGAYLFLIDAEAVAQLGTWFSALLVAIDAWNQPFAKAVILLGMALAFGILAVIFYRRRHGITTP